MNLETLKYERRAATARITLNRPKEMNAINPRMAEELFATLLDCESDPGVRAIVLTGEGRAFCAGGDVPLFNENINQLGNFLKNLTQAFHHCISQMIRTRKPIISAINGITAGGGMGLVLAADLAIASESAKFSMAYTGLGGSPDGATTLLLPRVVGFRRAMELTLLNRSLDAAQALDWGIVNHVFPDDKLSEEADLLAERLAKGPTLAYGNVKSLIQGGYSNSLETQMENESRAFSYLGATEDLREGVRAFVEKRKPNFQGK